MARAVNGERAETAPVGRRGAADFRSDYVTGPQWNESEPIRPGRAEVVNGGDRGGGRRRVRAGRGEVRSRVRQLGRSRSREPFKAVTKAAVPVNGAAGGSAVYLVKKKLGNTEL